MKLTRKKAIELCIELWTWLAETGRLKEDWPEWEKYDKIENDCWFCHYQEQQDIKYTTTTWHNETKNMLCRYCPLTSIKTCCQENRNPFQKWIRAKTPKNRKKYAQLFLNQIKGLKTWTRKN